MALAQAHGASRLSSFFDLSWAAIVFAALAFLGCDGDGAGAAPPRGDAATSGCVSKENLDGPDVSFGGELMPFFSMTCTFDPCHNAYGRQAGLYLGPNVLDGPANAAAMTEVRKSLLAQSTMAPALHRVVPFNPEQSFLMIKIRGCQNRVGLDCTGAVVGKPCGDRMPGNSDELPSEKKNMLARWILLGAVGASSDGGDSGNDGSTSAP